MVQLSLVGRRDDRLEYLEQLRQASPRAAGRNRTLGIKALEQIRAPVPPFEKQVWFGQIKSRVDAARQLQNQSAQEFAALFASTLDKAFRGDL